MKFILKNADTNRYVARPGNKHSYTSSLRAAQKFDSYESAAGHKCDNEFVVNLEEELGCE